MIRIVDYGMGNLRSVQKAFEHLGHSAEITADPAAAKSADRLVVPGVGAFPDAMAELKRTGLDQAVTEFAKGGRPLLGICLGLQLFMEQSLEYGDHAGLGLIKGKVLPFPTDLKDESGVPLKIPHMGWNRVRVPGSLAPLLDGKYVYFVHSYYAAPSNSEDVIATADYGMPFCAMAGRDNIWAAQFHPEKSGPVGLALLHAFATR